MLKYINKHNTSLQFRLGTAMFIVAFISVFIATLFANQREQKHFRSDLEQQASLLITGFSFVADDALYTLDVEYLGDLMGKLERSSLMRAQIFDASGHLIADTETVGNLAYSRLIDPFGQQLVTTSGPVFVWQSDRLVAGQAITAGNEIIGAISVALPIDELEGKINAATWEGVFLATLISLVALILSFFLTNTITHPLKTLTHAVAKIATDEYIQIVTVPKGGNELSKLAQEFNRMSLQLSETMTQLNNKALQLEKANTKIEEALMFKSQILSNISHDARTPLNVIMLRSEMLSYGIYGQLTPEQLNKIETIHNNAEQLLFFVNNLLDGAQLDAKKLILVHQPFDLYNWLDKIASTLSVLADKKGLSFEVQRDHSLPNTLIGDANRLQQIVFNLVGNAVKFTDEGGIKVKVYCPNDEYWSIEIADTGQGIPEAQQDRLFEAFYQVSSISSSVKTQGVGLGLSIVKQLIDLMNGQITIESKLGEGTTFIVTFPLLVGEVN